MHLKIQEQISSKIILKGLYRQYLGFLDSFQFFTKNVQRLHGKKLTVFVLVVIFLSYKFFCACCLHIFHNTFLTHVHPWSLKTLVAIYALELKGTFS